MKILVTAVGRMKRGPESDLCERYLKRAFDLGRGLGVSTISVREVTESRASAVAQRQAEEGDAILARVPDDALLIALDERGKTISTKQFSETLDGARTDARPSLGFVIGGPDGLSEKIRTQAHMTIAFGQMTLPHQLVRVILLEQIYRSMTILQGHPYHRE